MVPAAPTVTVGEKVELSVLTSNPLGGVTKMPAFILVPETLKVVLADGVPVAVVSVPGVPVVEMIGVGVTVLAGIATLTFDAPVLLKTILPE